MATDLTTRRLLDGAQLKPRLLRRFFYGLNSYETWLKLDPFTTSIQPFSCHSRNQNTKIPD